MPGPRGARRRTRACASSPSTPSGGSTPTRSRCIPTSSCPEDSEAEVVDALRAAIEGAGERRVVVVGHHPLASGGIHGGNFGWRDHIFPLRAKRSWLWIPLPGIGSAYPIARRRGVSDQDLSGRLERPHAGGDRGGVREGAAPGLCRRPRAQPAGHPAKRGRIPARERHRASTGTPAGPRPDEDTLFARVASGFMRLDLVRRPARSGSPSSSSTPPATRRKRFRRC